MSSRKTRKKRARKDAEPLSDDDPGHSDTQDYSPSLPRAAVGRTKRPRQGSVVATRSTSEDDIAVNDAASDSDAPTPVIGMQTRAQNKTRRPGKQIGLNWQAQLAEEQEAALKKAEKKASAEKKKRERADVIERQNRGVHRIAEIELAREREDIEDEEYLEASTAHGYRKTTRALRSQPGSGNDHNQEGPGASEAYSDNEEDHTEDPSRKKTNAQRKASKRVKTHGEIYAARQEISAEQRRQTSVPSTPSTEGSVFNNAYRLKLLNKTAGAASSPGTPHATLGKHENMSASRRGASHSAVLTSPDTSEARVVSDVEETHTPVEGGLRSSQGHRTVARGEANCTQRHGSESPSPDFGLRLLRVRDTPTPTTSRLQTPVATQFTPRLWTSITRDEEESDGEENVNINRGLEDDDTSATRGSIAGRKRGRSTNQLSLVEVEPDPPSKPKAKRRTRDEIPPSQSLSADNLPPPILAVYNTKILPTCIHLYGGFKDPWTISAKELKLKYPKGSKMPALSEILTYLLHQMVEDTEDEVVEETDLLYRVTRQRLINWCDGFLHRACTAVKEGYDVFIRQQKAITKKATVSRADVVDWANAALEAAGGEAWYKDPVSPGNDKPRGMFMSVYVLRAFAPHLAIVEKSCLEAREPQFGALAMAVAAVEVAFNCFVATGTYKPPVGNFDKVGGAGLCDKWLVQGVTNLYNKQSRWDEVMRTAKAQARTRVGSKRGRNVMIGGQRDRNVIPDSSSPVRSE